MKIVAIEHEMPKASTTGFLLHLEDEALKVWDLHKKDIVREIWFTRENHTAVIILECKNAAEAKSVLDELPLVKDGLICFEILELEPYDGYERLFKK